MSSPGRWGSAGAHLYFFDATGEAASLASGVLGALPLLWLVAGLGRCHYVDVPTGMGLGVVAGGGDVGAHRGGRAREDGVSRAGLEGGGYGLGDAIGHGAYDGGQDAGGAVLHCFIREFSRKKQGRSKGGKWTETTPL